MNLVPKPEHRKLLTDAARLYREQLAESEVHTKYLRDRGVTEDLQRSFGLGAVINPISSHEDYRGWIAIPYFTPGGITSLRFRRVDSDVSPKYLDLPGEPPRIYNTRALLRDEDIFLCEGEFDAIMGWSCGLATIAVNGASKWTGVFARILKHRDVTILQDGDSAGSALSKEVYKSLGGCRVVRMPKDEDVSSFVAKEGPDALIERIKNG